MSGRFPPVAELAPHAGPMRLLGRVLDHTPDATTCSVDPGRSGLFADADGAVPAWVGVEYMAQCIAVHGGLLARAADAAPRAGLFVGSRRVRPHAERFAPGEALEVTARPLSGSAALASFACEVRGPGGATLVEGRLNVYIQREEGDSA